MSVFQSLSVVALRQLVSSAGSAVGLGATADAITDSLTKRFTDHSQKLTKALQTANEKAWKAVEVALAGESLLDRCKGALAAAEDRAFSEQLRAFLAESPLRKIKADQQAFLRRALEELRSARAKGMLTQGSLAPAGLAQQTGAFAKYSDPLALLDAEMTVVQGIAAELKETCPKLCVVLTHPKITPNILVIAVRYYFRREVEADPQLSQGLAFAKLEALQEGQERGFAALTEALTHQGRRLEGLLDDLLGKVDAIHTTTADTNVMVRGMSGDLRAVDEKVGGLVAQVQQFLERSQLQNREVRPSDSLSIRNDAERQWVKQLVDQYRALPEEQRRNPSLLNNVGKLEVVAGDYEAANRHFKAAAEITTEPKAQAEIYHNAYQAAIEQQAWNDALASLRQAATLDAGRFAPFPLEKYEPQQILGAGGFGVAFLCNHSFMRDTVVVKTLRSEELDCDVNRVFAEAQALRQLDHPSIIRLLDCGYADPARTRAFLVMDYFDGVNLESYVAERGTLSYDDSLAVASRVAEALQAAHARGILHRDVKPANVLVRREDSGWRVKLIDFGLALRPDTLEGQPSSQSSSAKTTLGKSIAGTLHFAAPEQMGKLPGVPVGRHSDVYGFGRTCYYALLGDPEPDDVEREGLPDAWRRLLSRCTGRRLENRFADFSTVLAGLSGVREALAPKPTPPPSAAPKPAVEEAKPRVIEPIAALANVWVVRAGKHGEEEKTAIANNLVTMHWTELPDLSGVKNRDELKRLYVSKCNPVEASNPYKVGAGVGQVWAFRSDMKIGDLAIIPLRTQAGALAIGEVIGSYTYRTDLGAEVLHTLPVRWLRTDLPRSNLRDDLSRELGYPKTVYRINLENAADRFRTVLRGETEQDATAPSAEDASDTATPGEPKEAWNGEFYCNFNDGEGRSWADAVAYGFISAGGGAWYSKTLQLLKPGDRVWVNVPGRGFVGVGCVMDCAEPLSTFTVTTPEGKVPVLDVAKHTHHPRFLDDPERGEYFVPVKWLQTVPLEKAVRGTGFFGNQNTVCKPTAAKWRSTVERLKEKFPDFDKAPAAAEKEAEANAARSPSQYETDSAIEADDEQQDEPERRRLRLKFWEGLLGRPKMRATRHAELSPVRYGWIGAGSGVRGASFNYVVLQKQGRVELYIDRGAGKGEENKQIFDRLHSQKNEIEKSFGGELSWQRLDDKKACRISHTLTVGGYKGDESKWPEIHDAMIDAMSRFENAFSTPLANLKVD